MIKCTLYVILHDSLLGLSGVIMLHSRDFRKEYYNCDYVENVCHTRVVWCKGRVYVLKLGSRDGRIFGNFYCTCFLSPFLFIELPFFISMSSGDS